MANLKKNFLAHLSDGYIVCSFHISRHGEAVDRTLLKSLLRMLADLQVNSSMYRAVCGEVVAEWFTCQTLGGKVWVWDVAEFFCYSLQVISLLVQLIIKLLTE